VYFSVTSTKFFCWHLNYQSHSSSYDRTLYKNTQYNEGKYASDTNHRREHRWRQKQMSGYAQQVQTGCAERPTPGLGLYRDDCTESLDVADVRRRTVHQVHRHVAATAHSAFCVSGHDYNSYGIVSSESSAFCFSEANLVSKHCKQHD